MCILEYYNVKVSPISGDVCELDGLLSAHPVSDSLSSLVLPCSVLKCLCACLCTVWFHLCSCCSPSITKREPAACLSAYVPAVRLCAACVPATCLCAHMSQSACLVCTFVQIALWVYPLQRACSAPECSFSERLCASFFFEHL